MPHNHLNEEDRDVRPALKEWLSRRSGDRPVAAFFGILDEQTRRAAKTGSGGSAIAISVLSDGG
ncbi:MAG: hypothetical protein WCS40_04630 [Methanomethylophilus sp.]